MTKRRWRDGPKWPWLCQVLGHQLRWWHWYIGVGDILGDVWLSWLFFNSSNPKPSWHYNSTYCAGGRLCGRCGKVIKHGF